MDDTLTTDVHLMQVYYNIHGHHPLVPHGATQAHVSYNRMKEVIGVSFSREYDEPPRTEIEVRRRMSEYEAMNKKGLTLEELANLADVLNSRAASQDSS